MVEFLFDSSDHEEMQDFSCLPEGTYLSKIIESELRPTKAGDGERLVLTFEVLSGEFRERRFFVGLNIKNPTPETQERANNELTSISKAVGVVKFKDTSALHGKPMKVKLAIRKSDGYPPQNNAKKYMPAESAAAESSDSDGDDWD